jgi:helicase required for RNAi-mediated heterochromatin assembly 1
LISGSVVALTPTQDMFEKICRVAVVAARPLAGVQQNPPEIDIFFATPDQIELDPQQEWVMVECKDGYFEGSRHTLCALQKMTSER